MIRKSDVLAWLVCCLLIAAAYVWWSGLERRAADAAKPNPPAEARDGPAKQKVLKKSAKGHWQAKIDAAEYAKRLPARRSKRKMSALPGGYVRKGNGAGYTLTGSGSVKVRANFLSSSPPPYLVISYIDGSVDIATLVSQGHTAYAPTLQYGYLAGATLWAYAEADIEPDPYDPAKTIGRYCCVWVLSVGTTYPYGDQWVEVERYDSGWIEITPGFTPPVEYNNPVAISWSWGPADVGGLYSCPTPAGGGPAFSISHGVYTYHWFADENTKGHVSGGGLSYDTDTYLLPTDVGAIAPGFSASGLTRAVGVDSEIFTNLTVCGQVVDTSEVDAILHPELAATIGCLKGFGSGEARINTSYGPTLLGAYGMTPSVEVTFDATITKFGKHIWVGAKLAHTMLTTAYYNADGELLQPHFADGLVTPFNQSYVFSCCLGVEQRGEISGGRALTHQFGLWPTWAAAQDPPLPADDMIVPIQGRPPNGLATYQAMSITLAPEIEVLRPDGNLLSSFTSPVPSKLTVAESATETTFTVLQAGGTALRDFTTIWAGYFAKGGPLWDYFACRRTKHVAGTEDVYSWNTHGKMDLKFRCPVACTLSLYVEWVKPHVFDTYVTGSTRYDDWYHILHSGHSTYTIPLQALPDEDQTVRINLLFPTEGGPSYPGRVHSLILSGFVPMPNGSPATVVLKNMTLTSDADPETGEYYPYYVKIAPGPPTQRGKYSIVGIAHGGNSATMEIPDVAYKTHEVTAYGGNLRYCEPMSGVESGLTLDWQVDISTIAGWLNIIEGIAATYNEGASDAAISDTFTWLGPENADWLIPVYPHVPNATPGEAKICNAGIMCRTLGITNGIAWTVKVDHALMAGCEALTHEGNAPGEAGIALQAYYLDGGGVKHVDPLAAGTTDECGFAVVAPIPADEVRPYGIEQVPA